MSAYPSVRRSCHTESQTTSLRMGDGVSSKAPVAKQRVALERDSRVALPDSLSVQACSADSSFVIALADSFSDRWRGERRQKHSMSRAPSTSISRPPFPRLSCWTAKRLTSRCSQPLAAAMSSFQMTSTVKFAAKLAAASGG